VNVAVSAGFNDPMEVRDLVNNTLMPEISRAVRYGTSRSTL